MTSQKWLRQGLMVPSIAAFCAFAVLIGLGTWQIQRMAWKEALIATVTARFAATPIPLPPPADWVRLDPAADEFRRVRFHGEFLNDKEALVFTTGSSLHAGDSSPGYWAFVPVRVADRVVMVNRGFVPEGRRDPATRLQGQIAGRVEIVGVMRWPERPGLFTPAAEPAKNLWFTREPATMAETKGLGPVAPFYIELESPSAPGGLPQAAKLQPTFPNNHLGYALTWYGLALVLVGSFGVWALRRDIP